MNSTIQSIASAATINTVGDGNSDLSKDVTNILNGVIAVLGLACVVVMIVGGVNYMTSNGDTGKVEKGKKTILYGLIGLIICALSFTIVNFAISNILNGNNSGSGGGGDNTSGSGGGSDNTTEEARWETKERQKENYNQNQNQNAE